jgi:hypothetical protein
VYMTGRPPTAGLGDVETDVVLAFVPDVTYRCCTELGLMPSVAVMVTGWDLPAVWAGRVPKKTRAPTLVA